MRLKRRDSDLGAIRFAELAKTCSTCRPTCPGNQRFSLDFSIRISGGGVDMQGRADGTKVLIVDDEHSVADTLARIFQLSGYDVRVAYSAEEGIEIIASWEPRLALLDVMLPGMNGVEFAVVLKENHPNCQTLLFSGSDEASFFLREAIRKGHRFDIMAKPAHPVELLEAVKRLLAAVPETPTPLPPN